MGPSVSHRLRLGCALAPCRSASSHRLPNLGEEKLPVRFGIPHPCSFFACVQMPAGTVTGRVSGGANQPHHPTGEPSSRQAASCLLLPCCQPSCLPGVGGTQGGGGKSRVKLGRKKKVSDGLDQLPVGAWAEVGGTLALFAGSTGLWWVCLMQSYRQHERDTHKGSNDFDPRVASLCQPHG